MTDKVKVLLPDGTYIHLFEWQDMYGIKKYSNQIGKYFSLNEDRFKKDITLFGELIVSSLLMQVADLYRERLDECVTFNSFNRNSEYQKKLTDQGFRTAKFSPHEVKLAGDIDTPGINELKLQFPKKDVVALTELAANINRERAKLIKECAHDLKIKVRVGNEQYLRESQTFIHADVCPEYYAPGKPWHNMPHPMQWESPISW